MRTRVLTKVGLGVFVPWLLAGSPVIELSPVAEARGPLARSGRGCRDRRAPRGVAVTVWNRRLIGHGLVPLWATGWVGADETGTHAAGRFTLPRWFFAPALVTHVPEPQLGLFKTGPGGWWLQGWEAPLTKPGAVIEMRRLRSIDERRKYLEGSWTREERAQLRPSWQDAEAPPNWIDLPYREARSFGDVERPRTVECDPSRHMASRSPVSGGPHAPWA